MRLRRLAVRNFRKLAGPIVIDPIDEGLTLVSGDNEEGKSTLLAALKAALFEHHQVGGATREAMTPHGSTLVPEVELDFVVGGAKWRLCKAFRRGGVELTGDGVRLSGDAAEDRLVDLLRFQRRQGRADVKAEHHGLAALFWVDQGTSFAGFAPLATARQRIAAAVAGEVGRLTGGEAVAELAVTIRERCDRYWTATFREKGSLKEAAERCETLAAEALDLRRRVGEAADKEERLARLREPGARAADAAAITRARQQHEEAQRRLAGISALEQQAALAVERLKAGRAALAQAAAALERRRRMREGLAAEQARLAQVEDAAAQCRDAVALATTVRDDAETVDLTARATLGAAEAERDRVERRRLAEEQARELERVRASLAAAREAADLMIGLSSQIDADPATAEALAAAREAQSAHDRAAAALAAAATTIVLRPNAGAGASCDGLPVDPLLPLELTDQATLQLSDWGEILVTPGGADIAARRSAARASAGRLEAVLHAIGAATLVQAEQRATHRQQLEREVLATRARLETVLDAARFPSLDALAERVQVLEATTPPAGEADRPPDAAAITSAALSAARDGAEAAARALGEAERRAAEARQAQALTEQEAALLSAQLLSARADLAEAEGLSSDAALAAAEESARAACQSLEGEVARLDNELRLADREALKNRLDIAAREITQLESEATRRERAIVELESELRAMGEDGLAERLGEKEAQLATAELEHSRTRRDALAWKLLHATLDQTLRADRQALLAPVAARLAPWLARLFPDATPILDPLSFAPVALVRGAGEDSFESLSLGTREQIAVLVRLGVASLLAEREGEAPCLILDDALVYADETRFETMKTILQRAARQVQILVLTCRPRDYDGLDARYLRLEDCRSE